MTNEDVVRRLDKVIAILQLANHGEIEKARLAIRAEKANAVILDAATQPTPASELTAAVHKQTNEKHSARTVARRIAVLVDQGALEKSGAGSATKYKATGLI